jgi:non-heme chloroperoxidase
MPFVTVGRENSAAIRIYYEDHGSGPPLVLVHGYALNGHSWEKQEAALLAAGHRVITYDRRGSGTSSRPSTGYDFDTLAAGLHVLLTRLDLRQAVLAGFALGTGEVTRYLAVHGPARVKAAVLVAPLPPFPLKTHDNPQGIDPSVFDRLTAHVTADRPAAMKDFLDRSCKIDLLGGSRVSDQAWQNSFYIALSASAHAALGCITACREDFRVDLATISIPVLVIDGDQDRVLPYEATSQRLSALLENARSTVIAGGPHAIIWTHADEVNQALLDFIAHPGPADGRSGGPENSPQSGSQKRAGRLTLCRDRVSRPGIPHPAGQVGLIYDGELTGDLRARQIALARSAPGHRRSPGMAARYRSAALPCRTRTGYRAPGVRLWSRLTTA